MIGECSLSHTSGLTLNRGVEKAMSLVAVAVVMVVVMRYNARCERGLKSHSCPSASSSSNSLWRTT